MFSKSLCRTIASRNSSFLLSKLEFKLRFFQLSTQKTINHLTTTTTTTTNFGHFLLNERRFCTQKTIPVVYYDEIKDLPNHPEKLLIDVRDPNEVRFGKIPKSINIPLCELRSELAMNDCEEFRKKYGCEKPTAETYIIMHCRTGQRAAAAAEIACTMGYKNVHNYCGSWLDYVRNETCN